MIIYLAIVLLVGLVAGFVVGQARGGGRESARKVPTQADTKSILSLFKTKEKIKNDDVEKLLGVSDATATRYLSRLEERGMLIQRGKSKGTYYVDNT